MVYEGVSFNVSWIKKLTLEQFINHKNIQHIWPALSSEKRKARLKELYELILCEQ